MLTMILAPIYLFALPDALPPKVVKGDCASSDNSKKFRQKVYIDSDRNAKYDHVQTTDCNGKTNTSRIKGLTVFSPENYPIGDNYRQSIYFPSTGGIRFMFEITDTTTNFVVAQEIVYNSAPDTVYVSFFDPSSPLSATNGNRAYDMTIESIGKIYPESINASAHANEMILGESYKKEGMAIVEIVVGRAGKYKIDIYTNQSGLIESYEYDFNKPGTYKITVANYLLDPSSQWKNKKEIKEVTLDITRLGESVLRETIRFE